MKGRGCSLAHMFNLAYKHLPGLLQLPLEALLRPLTALRSFMLR
jgi:hypothetical protein